MSWVQLPVRLGRYKLGTIWMYDCLKTGKPSQYLTNHQSLSSLQASKSSTNLSGWLELRRARSPVSDAKSHCNPTWQVTLGSSDTGSYQELHGVPKLAAP